MAASIKWAEVTCLNSVVPSGIVTSLPPYLALTIFHVPISLFSVLVSACFGSPAVERPDVKAVTATRETKTVIKTCLIRTSFGDCHLVHGNLRRTFQPRLNSPAPEVFRHHDDQLIVASLQRKKHAIKVTNGAQIAVIAGLKSSLSTIQCLAIEKHESRIAVTEAQLFRRGIGGAQRCLHKGCILCLRHPLNASKICQPGFFTRECMPGEAIQISPVQRDFVFQLFPVKRFGDLPRHDRARRRDG